MFVERRGHSLRSGRVSVANTAYILTSVCDGRRPWFRDFDTGCAAARVIAMPVCWQQADLLAWVLMPDHMHLLVQLGQDGDISRIMQLLKSLTSASIRQSGQPGFAWQKNGSEHGDKERHGHKGCEYGAGRP